MNRPHSLAAILAAVSAVILVIAGGAVLWLMEPLEYSATTTLVVLPQSSGPEAASYYDTMSRGQIAETFAQILALRGAPTDRSISVNVSVVPDTSLIQVVATARNPSTAENAADEALLRVQPFFDELNEPYGVSVVQGAARTAQRSGFGLGLLAGIVAAVAVVVAIATFVAVRAMERARSQAASLGGGVVPDEPERVNATASRPEPPRARVVTRSTAR